MDASQQSSSDGSSSAFVYHKITRIDCSDHTFTHFICCYDVCFTRCRMMKKNNLSVLVIVCILLFLVHQFLQFVLKIKIPILDNYLDPLLLMPILLYLIQKERRFLLSNSNYKLPVFQIFLYFIIVSFICEWLLPILNENLYRDIWDVLMYGIGSVLFLIFQNSEKAGD